MKLACLLSEPHAFSVLRAALAGHGIDCVPARDEFELVRLLRAGVDAALADTSWDRDLEERLLCWAAGRSTGQPALVLCLRDGETSRVVHALQSGAADVVSPRLHPAELALRLRRLCRQPTAFDVREQLEIGPFQLHRLSLRLYDNGTQVPLTPREFALAWLLFSHAGQPLNRTTISLAVWGVDADISRRTVEQHIYQLRRKLGLQAGRGVTIRANYGQGYVLCVEAAATPPRARDDSHLVLLPRAA